MYSGPFYPTQKHMAEADAEIAKRKFQKQLHDLQCKASFLKLFGGSAAPEERCYSEAALYGKLYDKQTYNCEMWRSNKNNLPLQGCEAAINELTGGSFFDDPRYDYNTAYKFIVKIQTRPE